MDLRKPIKGYEGLYEISQNGDVFSLSKNIILCKRIGKSGYLEVRIKKDGVVKHKTIHRLLAEAFIPNPENKPFIDHLDGNKLNNSLDNLRWCTAKENSNNPHCLEKCSMSAKRAWKNGRKMSEEAVSKRSMKRYKKVIQLTINGEFIREWNSIKEAAIALKVSQGHIGEVCRGKRKTIGGYIFKWLDRPDDKKSRITVDSSPATKFGSEPLARIKKIHIN